MSFPAAIRLEPFGLEQFGPERHDLISPTDLTAGVLTAETMSWNRSVDIEGVYSGLTHVEENGKVKVCYDLSSNACTNPPFALFSS